jgi:hypothetical protein
MSKESNPAVSANAHPKSIGPVELMPRPEGFKVNAIAEPLNEHGLESHKMDGWTYVCGAEWSSTPFDAYYYDYHISLEDNEWTLWRSYPDPFESDMWCWAVCASAPANGVGPKTAATYILLDFWTAQANGIGLDRPYASSGGRGILSDDELEVIVRRVWEV